MVTNILLYYWNGYVKISSYGNYYGGFIIILVYIYKSLVKV